MSKKDFSFHFNIKTKTGKMQLGDKYIDLSAHVENTNNTTHCTDQFPTSGSASGLGGYGLDLI